MQELEYTCSVRVRVSILTALLLLPGIAFAFTFKDISTRYTDAPFPRSLALAVSTLIDAGVLDPGNNRALKPDESINRAELLKLALASKKEPLTTVRRNCFSDVPKMAWYSPFVCTAKLKGYIRAFSDGTFRPASLATYQDGLRIFLRAHGVRSATTISFEQLLIEVNRLGLEVPQSLAPTAALSRSTALKIAAQLFVYQRGELAAYLKAARGETLSSASSSVRSSKSSSASSSAIYDTLPTGSVHPDFLLLGEVGAIIAAGTAFIEEEALLVDTIQITLVSETPTVQAFLVYDQDRRYLGRASLDPSASTNRSYKLSLPTSVLTVPRRTSINFYVRPQLMKKDFGGLPGQVVQVSTLVLKGNGEWSSNPITAVATGTFPSFETARSIITEVKNAGVARSAAVLGTQQELGRFRIAGKRSDTLAKVEITGFLFDITQVGVTVTNVFLLVDGTNERTACTVNSSTITCGALDPSQSSLTDAPRTFRLLGDIALDVGALNPRYQVSLNAAGSVGEPGSISWSDGSVTFTWVGLESPLATGTLYE